MNIILKIEPDQPVQSVRLSLGQFSGLVWWFKPSKGWIDLQPPKSAVILVNQLVFPKLNGSYLFYFFSIKIALFCSVYKPFFFYNPTPYSLSSLHVSNNCTTLEQPSLLKPSLPHADNRTGFQISHYEFKLWNLAIYLINLIFNI